MEKIIDETKEEKPRAIQIQFKGADEPAFFELRRQALDFDLDLTGLSRLILKEWSWLYGQRRKNGGGPKPFQLPLFPESKTLKKKRVKK